MIIHKNPKTEAIYLKLKVSISFIILSSILSVAFQSCGQNKFEKKKIVYVNSYHLGHPSSDEIMDAVIESFSADSFELTTFIMDSKRNNSLEFIENRSKELSDSIKLLNLDILILSDDNAVKYLYLPYFKNTDIPMVFCGINLSASQYDLPYEKVTGMIEILPLEDVLRTMKPYYPAMKNLLVITENTTTSHKEKELLDTMFIRLGINATYEMVEDFDQWKSAFREGNMNYDMIYVHTNGAIKGWNQEDAISFVNQYIKVPLITCEDFMMPFVVYGQTKVAAEHGIWAANAAKKILEGKSPADIPIITNQLSTTWINAGLARKIDFRADTILLGKAIILD
ncbi:MAG: ABC transporter substrate-binding protein [Bacteroidales bacterium]|nr:ABC transporter substrate-binding protein [Bacteroidales bacterium]